MKATIKKTVYIVTTIVGALALTGCGNFLQYHLRQDPDEAMEEYLEEKYDDDVTCLEWVTGNGSLIAYWNQSGSNGEFSSKKYPGVTISCGARVKEDGWSYEFFDNYQKEVYRAGVQEIMEETAGKYFAGEYYVITEGAGKLDDDTVKATSFEEYIKGYLRYRVCILTEEMSDEDAIATMQKFVADVQSQGFQCEFYLGRANTNIRTKEEYYSELRNEGNEFDLWASNGIEGITKWLYEYQLPLTEGKSEPEIYIITEEE